jgi:hypothetical protein
MIRIRSVKGDRVKNFLEELRVQRWDDHRYYHHCRINQSLHLLSAMAFVLAYGLLFIDPAMAALVAWMVSMTSRQAGHFFFEPLGYDRVNQATHEFKEEIKVGYNLRRKVVLLSVWAIFARSGLCVVISGCVGIVVSHRAFVHLERCPDRLGLDDQNIDRSISRYLPLSQSAVATVAW